MTADTVLPWLAGASLLTLGLYRRFQRLFGPQPVQPRRMRLRMGFLSAVGLLLAMHARHQPLLLASAIGAGLAGVALARLGLRLTEFRTDAGRVWYTPHSGIGVTLSLLFLARLGYRLFTLYPALAAPEGRIPTSLWRQPPTALTLAAFGLVIGYYLAYYAGVLSRSRPPAQAVAG
jgi:cytochrome b561